MRSFAGTGQRCARLVLVVLVGAAAVLGLGAAPADAHAVLESTTPTQGSQVDAFPSEVTLTFGEAVTVDNDSVRVLASNGKRVDSRHTTHPDGNGNRVAADLLPGGGRGSYTVVWRIVSADGHPVAGTFTFGFGVAADSTSSAPPGSRLVGFLDGTARFVGYAGIACALGSSLFAGAVWGASWQRRATRLLFGIGLALVVTSSLGLLFLTHPYDAGTGIGTALSFSGLHDTLASRFGKLLVLRVGLVALAALIWALAKPARSSNSLLRLRPDAVVVGAVAVLTYGLAGHASTGGQHVLATVVDAAHIAAVSAWFGGLLVLVTLLRPHPETTEQPDAQALSRWSVLATGCVLLILTTGTYQSWRQIGSWAALTATPYGRLVLIKVGLLVLVLVGAIVARRWVRTQRHSDVAAARSPARLRLAVVGESTVLAATLGVAAVLVNVQPGRESYDPRVTKHLVAQGVSASESVRVSVVIDRSRHGPTDISFAVTDPRGWALDVADVSSSLVEKEKDLGPVRFTVTGLRDGRGVAHAVVVPESGRWQLTVQIRVGDVTSYAATTTYSVR